MSTLSKMAMILAIFAICALAFVCCNKPKTDAPVKDSTPTGAEVACPVCGLKFKQSESVATATYKGKTYYFFLEDHQNEFTLNPDQYTRKDSDKNETQGRGTDPTGEETR